ncbi:MAG TPA: 5'-3' exonuclease H3TH domain-containing protein [Solirubrobacteraceae bacterium]
MPARQMPARQMPSPVLIADVPWLLYRAFFSLPKSIVGADGQPVNALLGTVNAILAVLEARPARAVAACMGAEEAVYRVKLYPGYHAQREPMPPELASQWEKAPALLESLGWTFATDAELEADDVMFSYALAEVGGDRREERSTSGHESGQGGGERCDVTSGYESGRALLLTGDRDLYQAVNAQVAVVLPGKGGVPPTEIGPAQVRERYGIDPALVTDFIALRGDPSDGLPGAPGIGAKTAAELLNRYGPLEEVLEVARADDSDMRLRTAIALSENEELLRDFKRIATLVPIDGILRPPDRTTDFAGGARMAAELGMGQLARRLEKMGANSG